MRYVPHEYQEYAKEFIVSHKVSALFLDCGLGKTVITLTAIWELLFDYFDIRKILIIAPLRVCYLTWPSELEKWDHLSGVGMSAVLGSEKERIAALGRKAQVYVINRENVEWLVENHTWDFDMVVIDELSSFKSHKAKRFKALKKVRPMVRRIVGLTGTPAPNGLIDLWAEIGILDMGQRLGRFIGGYRERFFVPDKRSREMVFSYKPREGAEDMIYGLISDICISMKAVDYLDIAGVEQSEVLRDKEIIEEQLKKERGRYETLLDMRMNNEIPKEVFSRKQQEVGERIAELEQRMAQYGDVEPATEADVSGKLENLQRLMGQFTMPEDGEFSEEEMDKYVSGVRVYEDRFEWLLNLSPDAGGGLDDAGSPVYFKKITVTPDDERAWFRKHPQWSKSNRYAELEVWIFI